MPLIDDTYLLIGNPMAGDLKRRLRAMGFIDRAEVYARVLTLTGVEEYLRQTFRDRKDANAITKAYRIIDPTKLPEDWGERQMH